MPDVPDVPDSRPLPELEAEPAEEADEAVAEEEAPGCGSLHWEIPYFMDEKNG